MKRSQVVEAIAEGLLNAPMLYGGDKAEREEVRASTNMSRLKIAHEALTVMEELGMLPPGDKYTVHGVTTNLNNEWDVE